MNGGDWTDLRYNLVTASRLDLIHVTPTAITVFHVTWFIIAALLLLNLVTGAVINNCLASIEEEEHKHEDDKAKISSEVL